MPGRHAPPKVELEVPFSETLAGAAVLGSEVAGEDEILGGGGFSMRIRVRLPRLSTFENGNRVQGKVVEGEVRWEGQRKATPLERNGNTQLMVPLITVYRDRPQERRGLQMTHCFVPERGEDGDGDVIETWSSEPGGFALGVPGYFNFHHSNMSTYGRAAAAVVLVGSHHSLGSVHWYDPKIPRSERAFETKLNDYKIRPDKRRCVHLEAGPYVVLDTRQRDEDGRLTHHAERLRDSLRNGLRHLAKQTIRSGGPDLEHVLVPSRHGWKMRTIADVDRTLGEEADLDTGKAPLWRGHLRDIRALRITSAHRQGGNPMMGRGGVVGPDFRMRGLSNLRICDASVFPDNTGVNPQWTVLARAHLSSEAMLGEQQQEAHR